MSSWSSLIRVAARPTHEPVNSSRIDTRLKSSAATRKDRNKRKAMDSARWLGANRSDTRGIARICNDATGSKARFHVSISPGCSTSRPAQPGGDQPHEFFCAVTPQPVRRNTGVAPVSQVVLDDALDILVRSLRSGGAEHITAPPRQSRPMPSLGGVEDSNLKHDELTLFLMRMAPHATIFQ